MLAVLWIPEAMTYFQVYNSQRQYPSWKFLRRITCLSTKRKYLQRFDFQLPFCDPPPLALYINMKTWMISTVQMQVFLYPERPSKGRNRRLEASFSSGWICCPPSKWGWQSVDKNRFRLYSMMSKWNNDLAFEMRLLRSWDGYTHSIP